MDILDVERLLPHRPPILMLDRVVAVEPGVSGTGWRRFGAADPCFDGHFPSRPVLPGIFIIEALAQTLMVVMMAKHLGAVAEPPPGLPLGYLARVMEMSFQEPIEPGQEISFAVRIDKRLGQFTIASGRATHADVLCAKGRVAVAIDSNELEAALGGSTA